MHDLEGLIADLGTAGFRERLYGVLDGLAPTDHVSLLRHGSDGRIRLVCTASRPRWRFAQEAQRAYLDRFHALDPNREALLRPPAGALSLPPGSWLAALSRQRGTRPGIFRVQSANIS